MKKFSAITLISIIFVLQACVDLPSDFSMPEWDVDLNVPVTHKKYYLDEALETDANIRLDSSYELARYYAVSDTMRQRESVKDFMEDKFNGEYRDVEIPIVQGYGKIYVEVQNGAEIDTAHFKEGMLHLDIYNNSDVELSFELTLPGVILPDGSPYVLTGTVQPGEYKSEDQNIAEYSYTTRTQQRKDEIEIRAKVNAEYSDDNVVVNAILTETDFTYVEGIIPETELDAISKSLSLGVTEDVARFRGKVKLANPKLTVEGRYLSDFDKPFEMLLHNMRVTGKVAGESFSLTTKSGSEALDDIMIVGGNFVKTFDESNSNVADFLAALPEELVLSADATMNPNLKSGIAHYLDSLEVKVYFNSDQYIEIDSVRFSDTLDLEIETETREDMKDVRGLKLFYKITNAMPLNNWVEMTFCDINYKSLFSKQVEIESASVQSPSSPAQPVVVDSFIELDSLEIEQLSNSYFVILDMLMSTPSGAGGVYLSPDYWLQIDSYAALKYHVAP